MEKMPYYFMAMTAMRRPHAKSARDALPLGAPQDGEGVRPTALRSPTGRLPIITGFRAGKTMEAERLNQIEGTVADLRGRLAELRRYL